MSNVLWVITKTRERLLEELKHLPEYKNYKTSELLEKAVEQLIQNTKLGESPNIDSDDTVISFYLKSLKKDPEKWKTISEKINSWVEEYNRVDSIKIC